LPSYDLPGIVLPNYLDDVTGGRGSIVSIVRAADEIANRVQIFTQEQTLPPAALGNLPATSCGVSREAGFLIATKNLVCLLFR